MEQIYEHQILNQSISKSLLYHPSLPLSLSLSLWNQSPKSNEDQDCPSICMWDMFVNLDLPCLWLFGGGGGGELATIMDWLGFACGCWVGLNRPAALSFGDCWVGSLSFSGCYWGFIWVSVAGVLFAVVVDDFVRGVLGAAQL